MSEIVLALDQGGQSSRAIAFDRHGRQIASASEPVPTTHPGPGRYEQDPEALVQSVRASLNRVLPSLAAGATVRAGIATQRSSVVCWDRVTGRALSPVLSWRDRRNADWLRALNLDEARVHRLTGLRPSPHYGAAKLRWCLDHLPAVTSALDQGRLAWGPLASFLVFRITRERTLAADPVNASRTLLMDIGSGNWSEDLLADFGLPAEAMPPIVSGGRGFGTLDVGTVPLPLTLSTGDQAAALFAQGAPDPALAFVNAGTGAFALQSASWPNPEVRLLTSVVGGSDSGLEFALEGTVNGAASALEAEALRLGIVDWITSIDTAPSDGASIPVFLNGYSGLGSPWWRESFRSRYEGEGPPGARLTAVLESITFMLHVNLAAIRDRLGPPVCIRVGGGLSRLDGFCQRLADLSGVPVHRPVQIEATARGLAWLVGGREPDWSMPGGERFRPRPSPGLYSRFRRWQACMERALSDDTV